MSKSSKLTATMDAEQAQFSSDVLESIRQTQRGEFACVHKPETITARRAGRPVDSVKVSTKRPTTLRLDDEVLARCRASGRGWRLTRLPLSGTCFAVLPKEKDQIRVLGERKSEITSARYAIPATP